MLVKKSKGQKEYLLRLKNKITDFINDYKKRYNLFPWSEIKKIARYNINSQIPVKVNNNDYTVRELVKEIGKTKSKIKNRLKPSYYNYILRAYIKDSMHIELSELSMVYSEYEEELNKVFKDMKIDLMFCLEGLKVLNKSLKFSDKESEKTSKTETKSNYKLKKESEDYLMDELILQEFTPSEIEFIEGCNTYIESLSDIGNFSDYYENMDFQLVDFESSYMTEGANIDLIKLYNSDVRNAQKALKQAKKMMSKKNYKEAIKQFEEVKKNAELIKKHIKSSDDTTMEKIVGGFALLWKNFIFDIVSLGSFASAATMFKARRKEMIQNGIDKAPIKPDLIFNQKFDFKNQKWELTEAGIKKLENYNKQVAAHEAKVIAFNSAHKTKDIFTGVLTGAGIVATIGKIISIVLATYKSMEGAKKMLEVDMDKEHWDRMVTKAYNPLRAYMYQLCDEIIIVADRSIKKIKTVDKMNTLQESTEIVLSDLEFELFGESTSLYYEGANLENFKTIRTMKVSFRKLTKELKKYIKDNQYSKARETITKMDKLISMAEDEIRNNKSDLSETLIGFIINTLLFILQQSAIAFAAFTASLVITPYFTSEKLTKNTIKGIAKQTPKSMKLTNILSGIGELIKITRGILKNVKDHKGNLTADDFNVYKNKLLNVFKEYRKRLSSLKKYTCEMEQKYIKQQKENAVKENVEYEELINYKYVDESSGELLDSRNLYIECYQLYDELLEETEGYVSEGANLETREKYKTMKKEVKRCGKYYKLAMKRGDFPEARSSLKAIMKTLDETEKDIRSIESGGAASLLLGSMANSVIGISRSIFAIIPFVGAFIAIAKNLKYSLNKLGVLINNIKKSDNITADDFNSYKNHLLTQINMTRTTVKKLLKDVNEKEKVFKSMTSEDEKKKKAIKESVELNQRKLDVYEACKNGEITLEQREEIIQRLNDETYLAEAFDSTISDNVDDNVNEDTNLTNTERFDKVVAVLYERCNKGLISIEEREELIYKAKEMIFNEANNDNTLIVNKKSTTGNFDPEEDVSQQKETAESLKNDTKKLDDSVKKINI